MRAARASSARCWRGCGPGSAAEPFDIDAKKTWSKKPTPAAICGEQVERSMPPSARGLQGLLSPPRALALVACVLLRPAYAPLRLRELEVLKAFYNSTSGAGWTVNTNWDEGANSQCGWVDQSIPAGWPYYAPEMELPTGPVRARMRRSSESTYAHCCRSDAPHPSVPPTVPLRRIASATTRARRTPNGTAWGASTRASRPLTATIASSGV